ncbi:MAG: hypothetical protein K2X29_12765, partial [Candidatus Obscuribacterales bacterium]|nr:hypothetical protein [Candidatus Obscuribacterales bacterium]
MATTGIVDGQILPAGGVPSSWSVPGSGPYKGQTVQTKAGQAQAEGLASNAMEKIPGLTESIPWSSTSAPGSQCSNCHLTGQSVVTGQDIHTSKVTDLNGGLEQWGLFAKAVVGGGIEEGNKGNATWYAEHGWVQSPVNLDTMSQVDHLASGVYQHGSDIGTAHTGTFVHEGNNVGVIERSGIGATPQLISKSDFNLVHVVDNKGNVVDPKAAMQLGDLKFYVPDTKTSQIQDPIAKANQQQAIMDNAKIQDLGQGLFGQVNQDTLKNAFDPSQIGSNIA